MTVHSGAKRGMARWFIRVERSAIFATNGTAAQTGLSSRRLKVSPAILLPSDFYKYSATSPQEARLCRRCIRAVSALGSVRAEWPAHRAGEGLPHLRKDRFRS